MKILVVILALVFIAYNTWLIGMVDYPMNIALVFFTICILVGAVIMELMNAKKPEVKEEPISKFRDDDVLLGKVYGKEVWITKEVHEKLIREVPDVKERDKIILEFLHVIGKRIWGLTSET